MNYIDNDYITIIEKSQTGGWEPHIKQLLKEIIKPGMVAVDVGANIGVHAVVMAEAAGKDGHVIAVEPNPEVVKYLRANAEPYSQMHVIEGLVADIEKDSGGCMRPIEMINNTGYMMVKMNTSDGIIPVFTLDKICASKKVDCIKIDVQGYEQHVLKGASRIMREDRPIILVEIEKRFIDRAEPLYDGEKASCEHVIELLLDNRYVLFRLRHEGPPYRFYADHLCVPVERVSHKFNLKYWTSITKCRCDVIQGLPGSKVTCNFVERDLRHHNGYTSLYICPPSNAI